MITKTELNYVNSWASRAPYPGREYASMAMDKLEQSFNMYNERYADRKYSILFSNQEEIQLEIMKKNICHMLGVDYKNLSGDFFLEIRDNLLGISPNVSFSSYDLLCELISKKEKVLDFDEKNSKLGYSERRIALINYYKILIKSNIFQKLSDLTTFKYACINFDKDIFNSQNPNINFSSQSSKFLYTESDESVSPLFFMGLRQDINNQLLSKKELENCSENPIYIVETLIAPENIKSFFAAQEVVIPTQILIDNSGVLTKTVATPLEKIRLLKEYKALVSEYQINNSNINIYGDYMSTLMDAQRLEEAKRIIRK